MAVASSISNQGAISYLKLLVQVVLLRVRGIEAEVGTHLLESVANSHFCDPGGNCYLSLSAVVTLQHGGEIDSRSRYPGRSTPCHPIGPLILMHEAQRSHLHHCWKVE